MPEVGLQDSGPADGTVINSKTDMGKLWFGDHMWPDKLIDLPNLFETICKINYVTDELYMKL